MSTAQLRNPQTRNARLRPHAPRAVASRLLARLDTHTFDPTGADLERLDPLIPIDVPAPRPQHDDGVGVFDKAAAVLKGLQSIVVQLNSTGAAVERSAAAASARVALMLDEAQQRLIELEAQSSRVGAGARERVEKACETAAAVLGHDPRLGESSRPVEGSLMEVTARAESAVRHADDAVLRLSAMTDRAAQAASRLDKLDRAMSDATEQAAGLVQVARDVGGLVMHAERVKAELTALTAQPNTGVRGMGRRTLLSPPRPREEGEAQSAAAA